MKGAADVTTEEYRLAIAHDNIEYADDAQFGHMDEAVCDMRDAAALLRSDIRRVTAEKDDLAAYLRATWNSAHAQLDGSTTEDVRQFYRGRIGALEGVARRTSVQLSEEAKL